MQAKAVAGFTLASSSVLSVILCDFTVTWG